MNTDDEPGIEQEQTEGTEAPDPCRPRSSILNPRFFLPVFALMVFLGAMYWAKSRDPFERVWCSLKVPGHGTVKGVAVLPKPVRRCPVVVYLHGSGGTLMTDGYELRQLAELGLAAVGLEYDQTNQVGFDEQFVALRNYINRQPWAMTNATGCVGSSLGAQRTLSFVLKHSEIQPHLLVRLSGEWVKELEDKFKVQSSRFKVGEANSEHSIVSSEARPHPGPLPQEREKNAGPSLLPLRCQVLLVHGEKDEVFPVEDVRRLADLLKAHGVSVTTKILPDRGHGFEPDRALVTRLVGEYCKAMLTPNEPFNGVALRRVWPFWVYFVPSLMWAGFWVYWRMADGKGSPSPQPSPPGEGAEGPRSGVFEPGCRAGGRRSGREIMLRWVALALAGLAIADTGIHLIPPRLKVSEGTLNIARRFLVQPKMMEDFNYLSTMNRQGQINASGPPHPGPLPPQRAEREKNGNPPPDVDGYVEWEGSTSIWQGQRLKTLVDNVELANYNRNELINWKVDEQIYRDFVLSPVIENPDTLKGGHQTGEELGWRRPLWESFYPRVRHEQSPEAAAEIVARYLRERVTIAQVASLAPGVESIWKSQITDEKGFEVIYVAALRSVGIGARLDAAGKAEFWTGDKWVAAPRPIASSFVWQ